MNGQPTDSSEKFEKALQEQKAGKYVLRLYVAGVTPKSTQAIASIRQICETRLEGRFDLEVIDIYQQPDLVREQQIIAAPTLVKMLPPPLRRMVGDLSRTDRILVGLDLQPLEATPSEDDHP